MQTVSHCCHMFRLEAIFCRFFMRYNKSAGHCLLFALCDDCGCVSDTNINELPTHEIEIQCQLVHNWFLGPHSVPAPYQFNSPIVWLSNLMTATEFGHRTPFVIPLDTPPNSPYQFELSLCVLPSPKEVQPDACALFPFHYSFFVALRFALDAIIYLLWTLLCRLF